MSAVCSTAFGAPPDVPTSYFAGTDAFRQFGYNYFILVSCDYQFTDIMDPSEWTTAITANDIHISPPGALIINPPDNPIVQIEGCLRETVGVNTYLVDFATYQFGGFTDNASDSAKYWRDIFNNAASYHMLILDCNGMFHVADGWMDAIETGTSGASPVTIAGETPGFAFGITQTPTWVAGEADLGTWSTQFSIKKTGVIESALIPGVPAILG